MNIALILAGGCGKRMGQEIPKQFLCVYEKPILLYTLVGFQNHPQIDGILVVCIDGWQDNVWAYARKYSIDKLQWVITGGASTQDSIRNGIYFLQDKCKLDDIVIIHDGIRPLVEEAVLSDVIVKCRKYGNAVTAMPYNEQIFVTHDGISATQYIPRDTLKRVSTPQAYCFSIILKAYQKAYREHIGIQENSYANTLMIDLGEKIYFSAGSDKNIKLTTSEDLELFKTYLALEKEQRRQKGS
jgi:2-C-methyl-D-erythritol 4-phosphate cytidylyltransferase